MRWMMAFTLAALACGTWLVGCTDEEPPLGISVEIYDAAGTDPFRNVQWLRMRIEGDDIAVGSNSKFVPYRSEGTAELGVVPFGTNRQVIIEGWQAGADGNPVLLVSRGKSVRADIVDGQAEQSLRVQMAPVNNLSPLTDGVNQSAQALAVGRVGHTVTTTSRGEVVTAGGGTLTTAGTGWWDVNGYTTLEGGIEIVSEADNRSRPHDLPLFFARAWHTATALSTGQILFTGGFASLNDSRQPLPMVEIYPAASAEQRVLAFQLAKPRAGHTATLIADDGVGTFRVLVVGGDGDGAGTFEIYNPFTGSDGARDLPDGMTRRFHTATLFDVPNRPGAPAVLICGGESATGPMASCLVYDPSSDSMVTIAATLGAPRMHHTATYVPGRNYVYVAGGYTDANRTQLSPTIDVYTASNNEILQGSLLLRTARAGQAASLLPNNGVLLSGGVGPDGFPLGSVEVIHEYLDPAQNTFVIDVVASEIAGDGTVLLPFLPGPRVGQQVAFTESGIALLVGGAETASGDWSMPTDLMFYNPQ